jgi:ribonuclease-3
MEVPYNKNNKFIMDMEVDLFLKTFGIDAKVKNYNIFRTAFVHTSYITRKNENYINGNQNCPDGILPLQENSYERLEFIGDAVLNTASATYLFDRYEDNNEGFLSNMRIKLVNGYTLSDLSIKIGLNKHAILSLQVENSGGRLKKNITEDILEAFIGAIYLNFGFDETKKWIVNMFEEYLDFAELIKQNVDYKDKLIKYCQQNKQSAPIFIEKQENTESKDTFEIIIKINNTIICNGKGHSKKQAENNASKKALEILT